ncbi:MAG: tetratricopeptide repeat protein [Phycisphaerales bacterium]|nr:MAG: tetratricopeptide repeat protein [Phycisphaerales bacterium]
MATGQRREAEELFQQTVDLRPEQWQGFLDERCSTDRVLRGEVDRLLAHFGKTNVASLDAIDQMDELDIDLIGRHVGPYRLLRLLGEGGFGSVYMAQQERPIHRNVALKVIKLGMDTKQVIARFEAERQTLAMMNHPNIATVLDAGSTDTGRPYFVMELAEGAPLTEYCDKQCLSIEGRLELFVKVCYALQHAHQKGVIHRDIKPSNVLVTLQNGDAVPKIIDFGVAKAMSEPLTDKTLFTEFLQFIGTPQYMSPEQAEMSGLDMDTRTDLYSLSVILYELLTGTTPVEGKKLQGLPFGEVQRIICEQDPSTPSRRISELGDELEEVAKCRGVEPQTIKRIVRGDLDWIAIKALEKDRECRYQTAGDFAADVERYLRNEPVHAGRPGAGYRLRKFVRRNRVGILVGSLVAAALLTGSMLATFGLIRAREGERQAAREAKTAKAINAFFSEMLASVDPMHMQLLSAFAPGEQTSANLRYDAVGDVSVAEMMCKAAQRIDEVFVDKPELEAIARETIGMTLLGLGRYADAEPQLLSALDIRRNILGEDHPDTLRSMLAVGDLRLMVGRSHEAETLVRIACNRMRQLYGNEHDKTLSCTSVLASVLADRGSYDEADVVFNKTLSTQRRVLGSDHRDTLATMWRWSVSYFAYKSVWNPVWKLSEGQNLARELHEIAHRTLDSDDSLYVLSDPLLGCWHLSHYEYDKAEALLRLGLEQCRRVLGDAHPFTYMTMHALALSLQGRAAEQEKEHLHRQALAGLRSSRGKLYWQTIGTAASFARWYALRGKFEPAEELYRSLLDDCMTASVETHTYTLILMSRFADFLERIGKFDEAISVRRQRLAAVKQRDGGMTDEVLEQKALLATALMRMGRLAEGRRLAREVIDLLTARFNDPRSPAALLNICAWLMLTRIPADMRDLDEALQASMRAVELDKSRNTKYLDTLALAYHQVGDNDKAVATQTKCIGMLSTDDDANWTCRRKGRLVSYLLEQGKNHRADLVASEAVAVFRESIGEHAPSLAEEFSNTAETLAQRGHYAMAEVLFREALDTNRLRLGDQHERVAFSLTQLANICLRRGKYTEAEHMYGEALTLLRELLGDDHLAVARTTYSLGTALQATGDRIGAEKRFNESLKIYDSLGAGQIPEVLRVECDLVRALLESGSVEVAQSLIQRVVADSVAMFGEEHLCTVSARQMAGWALIEQRQARQAETLLRECVETFKRLHVPEQETWRVAEAESILGACLVELQRFDEAEVRLLEGYTAIHDRGGKQFAATHAALKRIVALYEAWGKPDEAAKWQAELRAMKALAASPAPKLSSSD